MHIVHVHIHVKPEHRDAFVTATQDNARNTRQEPGNLRFDILQCAEDPNRFVLCEVYRDESGMTAHKATAHYARWRDTVQTWMAEDRRGVRLLALYPEADESWEAR